MAARAQLTSRQDNWRRVSAKGQTMAPDAPACSTAAPNSVSTSRRRAGTTEDATIVVKDNWQDPVPVRPAELDAIATFLLRGLADVIQQRR